MKKVKPLRPSLLAVRVETAVRVAVSEGRVLDVRFEAERICHETGVSTEIVASELVEAAIKAHANIEFPNLSRPDPYTELLDNHRRWRLSA